MTLASVLFGLVISAFVSSEDEVMTAMTLALLPQFVLSGVMQPLTGAVPMILSYFTLGRWGTEGLARVHDLGVDNTTIKEPFMTALNDFLYSTKNDNLIKGTDSLEANLVALILLALLMYGIIYSLLKKKD